MIKHGMDVQKWAIQYLNPGQIPVTTFDQPLFALAKLVQWKWPESHGEAKHVVMLRGGGGGGSPYGNGSMEYTWRHVGRFWLDYSSYRG